MALVPFFARSRFLYLVVLARSGPTVQRPGTVLGEAALNQCEVFGDVRWKLKIGRPSRAIQSLCSRIDGT